MLRYCLIAFGTAAVLASFATGASAWPIFTTPDGLVQLAYTPPRITPNPGPGGGYRYTAPRCIYKQMCHYDAAEKRQRCNMVCG